MADPKKRLGYDLPQIIADLDARYERLNEVLREAAMVASDQRGYTALHPIVEAAKALVLEGRLAQFVSDAREHYFSSSGGYPDHYYELLDNLSRQIGLMVDWVRGIHDTSSLEAHLICITYLNVTFARVRECMGKVSQHL